MDNYNVRMQNRVSTARKILLNDKMNKITFTNYHTLKNSGLKDKLLSTNITGKTVNKAFGELGKQMNSLKDVEGGNYLVTASQVFLGGVVATNTALVVSGKFMLGAYNKGLRIGNDIKFFKGQLNMGAKAPDVLKFAMKYSNVGMTFNNVACKTKLTVNSFSSAVDKSSHFVSEIAKGNVSFKKAVYLTAPSIKKMALKTSAGVGKKSVKAFKGSGSFALKSVGKSFKFGGKSLIKGVKSSPKILSSNLSSFSTANDDVGLKGADMSIKMVSHTFKTTKKATKVTFKTAKKTAKGSFYTAKYLMKLYKKQAGKPIAVKMMNIFSDLVKQILRNLITNPYVIGSVLFILIFTGIVGGVGGAVAGTVGGIIEAVEELVEGLLEIAESVGKAIYDFVSDAVDWVKGLFSDDGTVKELTDVDIGNEMDVKDFLLGSVQIRKALFVTENAEWYNEFLKNGYKEIKVFNCNNKEIVVNKFDPETLGMMSDEEYVSLISPIWKSIILGKYKGDYSSEIANVVFENCFNTLTRTYYKPNVDLDNDWATPEFLYCDGQSSSKEGELKVLNKIGHYDLYPNCTNHTEVEYHTEYSNIGCCTNQYTCLGHKSGVGFCPNSIDFNGKKYILVDALNGITCTNHSGVYIKCKGHSNTKYCNLNEFATCSNYRVIKTIFGSFKICNGHTEIKYCVDGLQKVDVPNEYVLDEKGIAEIKKKYNCENSDIYVECLGHDIITKCYEGTSSVASATCDNQKTELHCEGYSYCKGHAVMEIYLGYEGFEELIDYYFDGRIGELTIKKNAGTISDKERKELSNLSYYREFAYELQDIEVNEEIPDLVK